MNIDLMMVLIMILQLGFRNDGSQFIHFVRQLWQCHQGSQLRFHDVHHFTKDKELIMQWMGGYTGAVTKEYIRKYNLLLIL